MDVHGHGNIYAHDNAIIHVGDNFYSIEVELDQLLILAQKAERHHNKPTSHSESSMRCRIPHGVTIPPSGSGLSDSNSTNTPTRALQSDFRTTRAFYHGGLSAKTSSRLSAVRAIGIRVSNFPRGMCTPWCSCICHKEIRVQTPALLRRIIGSVFIGFSGLSPFAKDCDQTSCAVKAQPLAYFTIYFPSWLLNRMVAIMLTTTPMAGPVMTLKTQRTVPGEADIFRYAKQGRVDKLKELFERGLASPHDVHCQSGVSALHLAISHQRIDVCKFLLEMNADPFLEDHSRWAAADNAWDKILGQTFPMDVQNALRVMFSDTECIERRNFGVLHKLVLGLVQGDVAQYLEASTADLNAVDSNHRTAVSLAAERGDYYTLQAILKHSPDVNISSSSGSSPLHFAACSQNPNCLRLLLDAGATTDALTNWEQTPLIYAAAYNRDARCAEILLESGARINHRDRDGITALSWTAIADNLPVASLLIQHDADLAIADENGDTFLRLCISGDRVQILTSLEGRTIALSAVPTSKAQKKSLCHLIAECASIETIKALQKITIVAGKSAVSIDDTEWRALLTERDDYCDELFHEATECLELIRSHATKLYRGSSDDDDDNGGGLHDEFEDAAEELSNVSR